MVTYKYILVKFFFNITFLELNVDTIHIISYIHIITFIKKSYSIYSVKSYSIFKTYLDS